MKILIVSDAWHPQVNGVVRTYEHLADELQQMGHTVQVIGPCSFPVTLPLPGYNEIRLTLRPYRRLARMIDDFKPDHIHIATEATLGNAARRYARLRGLDFSSAYHTHFPAYIAERLPAGLKPLSGIVVNTIIRYLRWFHAPSAALLLATDSLESQLRAWNFKAPMVRLTRGVDFNVFHPGDKTLFHDLKKPVAINVGRVAVEKGLEDFLRMDWPGSKVIVGDGPSRKHLQKKYPGAHFVGVKKGADLAAHIRSADVFVFPSRTDTFGIVLIEAMACGLPIAGYHVMGPKDIVTQPVLGALSDDLASAAAHALHSPGTPQQRHDHARTHYTWRRAAQQFEKSVFKKS
jgi:glycosyltransferase involved in cell wall biosynthesis